MDYELNCKRGKKRDAHTCHSMYLVPQSRARTRHGTPTATLTRISDATSGSKGLPQQTNFQMQNTEAVFALVLKDSQ